MKKYSLHKYKFIRNKSNNKIYLRINDVVKNVKYKNIYQLRLNI